MKNVASGPFAQIVATTTKTKQIQNIYKKKKKENKAGNLFLRFSRNMAGRNENCFLLATEFGANGATYEKHKHAIE